MIVLVDGDQRKLSESLCPHVLVRSVALKVGGFGYPVSHRIDELC